MILSSFIPNITNKEINDFRTSLGVPLYIALVSDSDNKMTDLIFGKENEDVVRELGRALYMYAKYNGDTRNFPNLQKCNTTNEIKNDYNSIQEILESEILKNKILNNDYAYTSIGLYKSSYSIGSGPNNSKYYNKTITFQIVEKEPTLVVFSTKYQYNKNTAKIYLDNNLILDGPLNGGSLTKSYLDLSVGQHSVNMITSSSDGSASWAYTYLNIWSTKLITISEI